MRIVNLGVIHCSASKNGDARTNLAKIREEHKAKGWKDIGYHYVIEVDGKLATGRPIETAGAHAEGHNANSIGICMVGTDKFSLAQWATLAKLTRDLESRIPKIKWCGHRDLSPDLNKDGKITKNEWVKLCPSFEVTAWLVNQRQPLTPNILTATNV